MNIEEILNSSTDVRRNTAGNPNTPVEVLSELAKDGDCDVRRNTAERKYIVTKTYVATKGTSHLWYKHRADFYTCGCFIGSREQLLTRIYSTDASTNPAERMKILNDLDNKFNEVFNLK
jgi:hypothetical protein